MRKSKPNTIKIVILTAVISFVLPFFALLTINTLRQENVFATGTMLCGVDVGGLNSFDARHKLEKSLPDTSELKLTLKYKDKTWQFTDSDFEVHSSIHTVLSEIDKMKKSRYEKARLVKKIKKMGFSSMATTNYILKNLDEKLGEIDNQIKIPATEPLATFSGGKIKIIDGKNGQRLDRQKTYEEIEKALLDCKNSIIDLQTLPVEPVFSTDDVKKTKLLGTFSTNYSSSNYARKNNIKKAVSTLNNQIIMPNKEFSFNEIIGKRTEENGYLEANIIKKGEFVKGLGGGVCQVSSTLYNALILSNITITEAHKHSLPVSYVEKGMDAMVSWGSADLKFKNDSDLPIYISGTADGNKITFRIISDTNKKNYTIKTRSEVIKKISAGKDIVIPDSEGKYADKIMFKGEFLREKVAKDGYEVETFVDYYLNGKLHHTKSLRHATYAPQKGVVYEGCETLPKGMTLPKDKFTTYSN